MENPNKCSAWTVKQQKPALLRANKSNKSLTTFILQFTAKDFTIFSKMCLDKHNKSAGIINVSYHKKN